MVENNREVGSSYYVNSCLFFIFELDHILAWDYRAHCQYLLDSNYFKELSLIAATGYSSNEEIIQEFLAANLISTVPYPEDNWGWDVLSKIYHIGCQNAYELDDSVESKQLAEEYIEYCKQIAADIPNLYSERPGKLIDLPPPNLNLLKEVSYFDVLNQRKTCRAFNSEFISIDQLSNILFASFGLIHGEWEDFKQHGLKTLAMRKAYPASGGLHSEEAYIVVYRVDGLESGLYHYRPQDHKLSQLRVGDFENEVMRFNMNQFFSQGLAFGVYVSSRFDKIWWKYKHSRSYRVAMLDLGHVSQTFLLNATAFGLNTWITGAFRDDELNAFLGIDGIKESAMLFVGGGIGTGQSIPNAILSQFG